MPKRVINSVFFRMFAAVSGLVDALDFADGVQLLPWFSTILLKAAVLSCAAMTSMALGMPLEPTVATGIQRTCRPAFS